MLNLIEIHSYRKFGGGRYEQNLIKLPMHFDPQKDSVFRTEGPRLGTDDNTLSTLPPSIAAFPSPVPHHRNQSKIVLGLIMQE